MCSGSSEVWPSHDLWPWLHESYKSFWMADLQEAQHIFWTGFWCVILFPPHSNKNYVCCWNVLALFSHGLVVVEKISAFSQSSTLHVCRGVLTPPSLSRAHQTWLHLSQGQQQQQRQEMHTQEGGVELLTNSPHLCDVKPYFTSGAVSMSVQVVQSIPPTWQEKARANLLAVSWRHGDIQLNTNAGGINKTKSRFVPFNGTQPFQMSARTRAAP